MGNRLLATGASWLGTSMFLPCFAGTLVLFDPLQRLARSVSRKAHENVVAALNRSLRESLRLVGTRISVVHTGSTGVSGPAIIVANHQSLFDIPLLYCSFPRLRPRFIAKRSLERWIPSVSFNLRRGGNAIIDRSNPVQSLKSILAHAKQMRAQRFATVIFPEGTRAREGRLKNFKSAGFEALIRAAPDAAIIPVAIDGSWRLARRSCLPVPWGCSIRITIGAPLRVDGSATADDILAVCREFISSKLPAVDQSIHAA